MFNIPFHKINWDGRLRAHVTWLCMAAWRKLVSTEVHSKLQGDTTKLRLPAMLRLLLPPPHI